MSCFFFSSRRRHTRLQGDWSSDVCSSDLGHVAQSGAGVGGAAVRRAGRHRGDAGGQLGIPEMGTFKPTGVNPQLVWNVRRALDREGFQHVKIVVSGGFTVEKIRQFEEQDVPVDMYGIGSSLFQGRFDFTADVVRVEGKPCAKVGRSYRPNPRLERVERVSGVVLSAS